MTLGIVYSPILPIIAPVALLWLLIINVLWKWDLVFVFTQRVSGGGRVCWGCMLGVLVVCGGHAVATCPSCHPSTQQSTHDNSHTHPHNIPHTHPHIPIHTDVAPHILAHDHCNAESASYRCCHCWSQALLCRSCDDDCTWYCHHNIRNSGGAPLCQGHCMCCGCGCCGCMCWVVVLGGCARESRAA